MKVLFVEPPKDIWFVMGEYLPPPFGIIQLAAYLEREVENVEIEVLDCNAQQVDWAGVEKRIESFNPDIVASSVLATCNTYVVLRTLETAKRVNPDILTVAGGQHFTATAQESLETYPEIDVIVRGEGEQTFAELVKKACKKASFPRIRGISFRHDKRILHNPPRPLLENLDDLPYPGYHFVKDIVHKYHFSAMTGRKAPYALIEGSRGCPHRCTFCTQWKHWQGTWRVKSSQRIADEMEFCYHNYGSRFTWLTDDNFGFGKRASELADEIIQRGISEELMWFTQARCDDVVKHEDVLPKMHRAGLRWVLLGVESPRHSTLETFRKDIAPKDAKEAVKLLKENDIFAHAMFIIGERKDTARSIAELREFVNDLDPDFAIFSLLTPFPGTEIFEEAKGNGWIEDFNWSHYDMVHAIMPTETLSSKELQEELYRCYRSFYGSFGRRLQGMLSGNEMKKRVYWYMAARGIIKQFKMLSLATGMPRIGHNSILMFAISVSIFGIFIVLVLTLKPPMANENFFWRKPLVGAIFSLICVFGIIAAFSPRQCSESFHFRKEENNSALHAVSTSQKGHHLDCEKFSAHVMHISNHTLCAACTGLLLGALIALAGTIYYFFNGWSMEKMSLSAVLIGVVGVVFGFFQLKFRGLVRLMLNTIFVLGAFLILAGIDELTQSLYVDLFLIVLIVFWLSTRILLSQWNHWRICCGCKTLCEVRKLKRK